MSGVSALSWLVDASLAADSGTYGALIDVAGDGAQINVSAKKLALAGKVSGFTFKFNRSTGIFSGKTALSFEKKASLAATYKGVVLPGWFSDCDCGEDLDSVIEIESMPFGLGYVLFTDKVNRKSVKRSFAVGLDSLQ